MIKTAYQIVLDEARELLRARDPRLLTLIDRMRKERGYTGEKSLIEAYCLWWYERKRDKRNYTY